MSKVFSDALVIARIQTYPTMRDPISYLVFIVILPLAMLFFAANLQPEEDVLGARLIAGSMVFSLGISTVNALAQTLVFERFNHQLQMLIVSPIHKLSYALGCLGFATMRGALGAMVLIVAAPLFGFSIELSPFLLPIALLTAMSMAGISLTIGTWAKDQTSGNMLAQVIGILVVMLSPIYFDVSRLPGWMEIAALFSPYTHAANALEDSLSGVLPLGEIAILTAITCTTMSLGIAGMRWRDI